MEKEKWISEVLTAAEGISRPEARADLWKGISARIAKPKVVSTTIVWIAAASMAVLVALNVVAIRQSLTQGVTVTAASTSSLSENNFNLY
jgi:hypothetical protein